VDGKAGVKVISLRKGEKTIKKKTPKDLALKQEELAVEQGFASGPGEKKTLKWGKEG